MLVHLVCFKYRPEITETERKQHRDQLRGLAALEGVVELKVGADVVRSGRSYDTGLVATFENRTSLDRYQVHPEHVPVAKYGASLCEHIVAVDFEP